jgi:peptidoglycan hydrolase CwlO-like protein
MMERWTIITNVITALATAFGGGGLFVALASRKKMSSEIKAQDSQTAETYNRLASDWIDRLERKIKDLESEITILKETIRGYEVRVESLVRELGKTNG